MGLHQITNITQIFHPSPSLLDPNKDLHTFITELEKSLSAAAVLLRLSSVEERVPPAGRSSLSSLC